MSTKSRISGNAGHLCLLLAILMLGIFLRFVAIAETAVDHPIRADAKRYYTYALNLKYNNTFSQDDPNLPTPKPDAFGPPAFPFLIMPLVEKSPTIDGIFAINAAQATLSSLTILLAYWFFTGLSNRFMGLGAALLTALSPHLVVMTTYILTETTFTFFLALSMCLLLTAWKNKSMFIVLAGGLTLALSALTRSTTEYMPLFFLAMFFFVCERQRFIKICLPFCLSALFFLAMWKLRNFIVVGHTSDPGLMIRSLHDGMYPWFLYHGIPETLGYPYLYDPNTPLLDNDLHATLNAIKQYFVDSPISYSFWFLVGKPIFLLSWRNIDGMGDIFIYPVLTSPYLHNFIFIITASAMKGLHAVLSIAAVMCCIIAMVKPQLLDLDENGVFGARIISFLILYFFAIHIIGAPYPRYGIPLRPFVYGFGLYALVTFFKKLILLRSKKNHLS